jgi:integrase/recombinase XerD
MADQGRRSKELARVSRSKNQPGLSRTAVGNLPAIIEEAGNGARFAWDEFFRGELPNENTRKAYLHAVRQFLAWCEASRVELHQITPGQVGSYLSSLTVSIPTKKQHLAAIRKFFDRLVVRHVIILNPASSVRAERYQVVEGKTPEITVAQARKLLASLSASDVVTCRDKAIIGVLIYTAARIGAVTKLRLADLRHDGEQWTLRFSEKGGKSREIPVRHDLQKMLLTYLDAAELSTGKSTAPLFRSAVRRTEMLSNRAMSAVDGCRMVKRRLLKAKLPDRLSPHSFRVTTITNLLENQVSLEEVQFLAGHADPRTTRLYDRRQKRITRNIVERIAI